MTQLDQNPVLGAPSDFDHHSADQQSRLGRKRDHTRDPEILEAALDVLAETGYERMTIDLVAARAKAGKATLYRRWPSKGELVIEAVACLKNGDLDPERLVDTGTLRGDLLALIRPHTAADADRRAHVMAGVASMLSQDRQLAAVAERALFEPRVTAHRVLLARAVERGEIAADTDIETVATIAPAMTAYRSLISRRPMDRDFLVSVIDHVVLPAVGLRVDADATRS